MLDYLKHNSISVDGACSKNPGPMEYRGLNTLTKEVIFHKKFETGTNNIAEFLALVHALAWCKKNKASKMIIYTDSKTAISWVKKRKCKTTFQHPSLQDIIQRAETWLLQNSYENIIIKWETSLWGEIVADFNRKK